jgi:hypothetical protein
MEHSDLYSLQDKSVGSLNLHVHLWVRCGRWLMMDAKICTTPDKLCSFELYSIICQNYYGHTESVYDALHKLDCCILGYIHCWHDFHLLGEHVNSDEQISETTWCPRQDAYDVDSPDCKRLRDNDRMKRIVMLRRLLLKELTISTFVYDFHCIIIRCGSVKSMLKRFPND